MDEYHDKSANHNFFVVVPCEFLITAVRALLSSRRLHLAFLIQREFPVCKVRGIY